MERCPHLQKYFIASALRCWRVSRWADSKTATNAQTSIIFFPNRNPSGLHRPLWLISKVPGTPRRRPPLSRAQPAWDAWLPADAASPAEFCPRSAAGSSRTALRTPRPLGSASGARGTHAQALGASPVPAGGTPVPGRELAALQGGTGKVYCCFGDRKAVLLSGVISSILQIQT